MPSVWRLDSPLSNKCTSNIHLEAIEAMPVVPAPLLRKYLTLG